MKSVEITARSVDEAIKQALGELKLDRSRIDVEILEEPSKGFLGFIGGKQARIKATEKITPVYHTKEFIEKITRHMGVKTDVLIKEETDYVRMTITGGNNLGVLIGRRGETLDALQYLANLVTNKHSQERKKIIIDAEGYRQRREETLMKLASRLAERVKRTGHRVVLEPMNPQERRIIHTALQNDSSVQTLSEGEEPFRKVVISLRR